MILPNDFGIISYQNTQANYPIEEHVTGFRSSCLPSGNDTEQQISVLRRVLGEAPSPSQPTVSSRSTRSLAPVRGTRRSNQSLCTYIGTVDWATTLATEMPRELRVTTATICIVYDASVFQMVDEQIDASFAWGCDFHIFHRPFLTS